jgi:hypothetical protein
VWRPFTSGVRFISIREDTWPLPSCSRAAPSFIG